LKLNFIEETKPSWERNNTQPLVTDNEDTANEADNNQATDEKEGKKKKKKSKIMRIA
jgi:hypothetical protein